MFEVEWDRIMNDRKKEKDLYERDKRRLEEKIQGLELIIKDRVESPQRRKDFFWKRPM